jgi:hypothetical protein
MFVCLCVSGYCLFPLLSGGVRLESVAVWERGHLLHQSAYEERSCKHAHPWATRKSRTAAYPLDSLLSRAMLFQNCIKLLYRETYFKLYGSCSKKSTEEQYGRFE